MTLLFGFHLVDNKKNITTFFRRVFHCLFFIPILTFCAPYLVSVVKITFSPSSSRVFTILMTFCDFPVPGGPRMFVRFVLLIFRIISSSKSSTSIWYIFSEIAIKFIFQFCFSNLRKKKKTK